jgi:hypothetical protein
MNYEDLELWNTDMHRAVAASLTRLVFLSIARHSKCSPLIPSNEHHDS